MESRWIKDQLKAFTNWCNHYLSERMLKIEDLTTDLSNGIILINLLEILSDKNISGYIKKPSLKLQKIQNLSIALNFLKNEGVKLVGISGEDIVDGNIYIILGAMWTIILKYHLCFDNPVKSNMLSWVNHQLEPYNISVSNFTKDWESGRALCALTDSLKPGILPPSSLSEDRFKDITKALNIAQEQLNIPKIVFDEQFAEPDELSIMTYIGFFKHFKPQSEKE
eukprot:TRINITY_DN2930_c0_g1_i1.p1 TRINITY_DN2930_c0_g1~~TRINITY_DN2930_c0_g1_i1.p1  ORF type:complete len:224 (-),score=36.15 TRINITY_DN2930_c0_g1_i1:25-696(-)